MTVGTGNARALRWLIVSLAAVLLVCLFAASPTRAVKLGGFFEHTLYTQGRKPLEAFKPRVLLLLHGFKSAMPNHDFHALQKIFGETYTVAGYNYDYTDVAANVADIDALIGDLLKDRDVIVLGTSLGGFWANYMAEQLDIDGAILVNPSIKPDDTMRRNFGTQYSKRRDLEFEVTEEAVAAYAEVARGNGTDPRRLVLLSKDDHILDYRESVERFADASATRTVVFEEGGHNLLLERPDVLAEIQGFIDDVWPD